MANQHRIVQQSGHKRLRLIARLLPDKTQREEPAKIDVPSQTNDKVSCFPTAITLLNATTTTIEKTDATCENEFKSLEASRF